MDDMNAGGELRATGAAGGREPAALNYSNRLLPATQCACSVLYRIMPLDDGCIEQL